MSGRGAISWVFDRLLRHRGSDDPEIRFRTELVLGFGAFELLGAVMFALAELSLGTPAVGVIYALASIPMFAILVRVWRGGDATRGGIAVLAVLFVAISAVNFGAGGRAIGANLSLPTLVLFAVLMSTPRAGLIWTALVIAEIIGIAFLRRSHYDFPIKPNMPWVAHAVDRVPLLLSLISALIGSVTLRALDHYRSRLEWARTTEAMARKAAAETAARFADFAEVVADGYWETDDRLRLTYVSARFAQAFGLPAAQMIGLTPEQAYRLRFPEAPDLSAHMAPLLARKPFREQLLQTLDHADRKRILLNQGRPIHDDRGKFAGFRGAVQDITEKKVAERALRDSEHRLRLVTDNTPALISYIDTQRIFRFNNSTYAQWLGRPLTEITGRPVADVYDATTYRMIEPHIDRALKGERVDFEMEPQGSRVRHVRVTYVPEFDGGDKVLGIFGMVHDVTELKKIEGELRILAEIDSLTGMANRNRFNARLATAIEHSVLTGEIMALLFLDLDDFKAINDSLGHAGGDQVLQEFARRLSHCVRPNDTVARLAGDEFVIVVEGLRHPEDVGIVAEKIIAIMAEDFSVMGQVRQVTASVGIAIRRPDELDGEPIMRRADSALYAVKSSGRGKFRIAD
jgi:diguanylate cyclase (GGDEF)-like protein/PAS domain S-box-containing protein